MKKKEAHKEDGAMEDAGMEAGAGDPAMDTGAAPPMGSDGVVAPNPDHADQSEDTELFKQLIAQYLGDDQTDNGEAMKMCKEAYGEALSSGMSKEEAMKCAGFGMKCANLLHQKETRESAAKEAGLPADQANKADPGISSPGTPGLMSGTLKASGLPPKKADQSADKSSDGKDIEESAHKEAAVIKLTAENVSLKESLRKLEVGSHLNKLLERCGVPVKATDAFRELVKDKRSTTEIDAAWKLFKSAFTETAKPSSGLIFGIEKQQPNLSINSNAEGVKGGFQDCVEKTEI